MTLQGLIFDVDGTLADTEEIHRQAFNHTFNQVGLRWDWTPRLYEDLLVVSGGQERITHYARAADPKLMTRPDFAEFVGALHERKTARYTELLYTGHIGLRPGIGRVLLEARGRGLALGIATSSAWSNVKTLLDNNLGRDWQSWFAAVETCDTVPSKKPSPAVYAAALRRMRLDARECMAFEDTENGLRAAQGAGLATIITTHRFTRDHAFAGAALVLDGLGEPEHPMAVLRGAVNRPYVDIALLERLLTERAEKNPNTAWQQTQIAFA
jgi:beta-phosphoglucomutase-like phosphatase (HAD superfamily)